MRKGQWLRGCPTSRRNRFIQIIPICLLIAAVGVIADRENTNSYLRELRTSLIETSLTLRAQIERELAESFVISRAMVAEIALRPELQQNEFSAKAERLIGNSPEIINIAAAPGLIVKYVYPLERNSAVLGLNYRSTNEQLAAVELARVTRKPVLAGPVDLMQGQVGFIVRDSVYFDDPTTQKEVFWGVVSVVVDSDQLFRHAGNIEQENRVKIAIRGKDGLAENGGMVFGDSSIFFGDPVLQNIELPFGSWQLAVLPVNGWPQKALNSGTIWAVVLLVGFLAVLFLDALFSARAKKEQAQRQLIDAIETIEDGFVVYDAHDRFVMCNSKYREFYRKSAHLFVYGRTFTEIIKRGVEAGQYPEAKGREEEWCKERIAAHSQPSGEIRQKIEDGRWLKISERKTPDGGTVGFRVDITELVRSREAAVAAEKAKSDFLANINHEMRTPLTVIQGYSAFLLKPQYLPSYAPIMAELEGSQLSRPELKDAVTNLLSDLRDYAGKIRTASQTLLSLINDSLDFSDVLAGNMVLASDRVNAKKVAESVIEDYKCQADARNVALLVDIDDMAIRGDEARIRQILENLVSNAVKFTEDGQIEIKAESDNGFMNFKVSDTGIGIDETRQKEIFETFAQGDGSNTRAYGGTGLGLALCYNLVKLHGGCLKVISKTGVGSTFSFTIPLWSQPQRSSQA